MKSVEQLKIEALQTRHYRTKSNYADYLAWHVNDLKLRIPSKAQEWDACVEARSKSREEPVELSLKHLIHWGKADARVIEDAFGLSLPKSVHEFYSEIQEAVLVWKEIFHFLHPNDVVAWEREYRVLCEDEDLPVRLIRFCKMTTGASVALRISEHTGKWSIVHASVDTPTEEMQSPIYDDPENQVSDDLDNWLLELMQDDGQFYERQWVERIG